MSDDKDDFFIGWAKPPKRLRRFLATVSVVLIAGFAGLSLAIGGTKPDPGPGAFRFDWGRQTVQGVLTAAPYPTITVVEGSEKVAASHTLMLTGVGKQGVQDRATKLDGKRVEASGVLLKRGDLDMMQARGGENGLKAVDGGGIEGAPGAVVDEPLGRWRLSGEICDGKCLAGAMRPGTGLAHKACANLCIYGGAPPVFVASAPVEGSAFLLLSDQDGGPLGDALYDHVGRLTTLEGDLYRRGDLLIFRTDLSNAAAAP